MRSCLRQPIDAIFEAADLLDRAATAHRDGRIDEAKALIREADIPAIADWTKSIWGKIDPVIHAKVDVENPLPFLPKEERHGLRMPGAMLQQQVIRRDGYHCRFCGIPVVPIRVRRRLNRDYPDAARWGRKEAEQHAALQAMWLQFDHIVPHTRGGLTALPNLVVTCGPCNFGRAQFSIEEMGLNHPLKVAREAAWPGHSSWDGLTRILAS